MCLMSNRARPLAPRPPCIRRRPLALTSTSTRRRLRRKRPPPHKLLDSLEVAQVRSFLTGLRTYLTNNTHNQW